MSCRSLFLSLLLSVVVAAIHPTHHKSCFSFIIPVEVEADLLNFKVAPFASTFESKEFLVKSIARDANLAALVGNITPLKKTYNIAASYCAPLNHGPQTTTLQILTHGFGFDSSYWNFGNDTYNYMTAAANAGYATLTYDRIGVGNSDHPDPYFDVQSSTQLAILVKLTQLARNGKLCSRIPKPQKVVHVGHSYGSLISNALVATHPDLSDGLVLTGFSHNTTWTPLFLLAIGFQVALESNPRRFGNFSSGYLTWGNKYDNQAAFFNYPDFDPAVLEFAERTKAPFAIGELLSFGALSLAAPQFHGPVLMISGQYDLPFCGGDCAGVLDGPYSSGPHVFPASSDLQTYVQPGSGHGLNLHTNASAGYNIIGSFLSKNKL